MKKNVLFGILFLVGCSSQSIPQIQSEKVVKQGFQPFLATYNYTIAKDSAGRPYVFLHVGNTEITDVLPMQPFCKEAK